MKQIFVNLPVKDLRRSMDFFGALGFAFNPQFTNEKAACLILGENIFAMLLVEAFFQGFSQRAIPDTARTAQVLLAVPAGSRAEVDAMVAKAVAAGGTAPRPPQDHGVMYSHDFDDPDGHIWEVFHMDEAPAQG
ncbi:VOC family protein [Ancylobacter terrae]|uniref:VOC family protein n=1 Tax=Ancylobacter sp. sgz301288 TaxID=3342077 RepID=UPI0038590EFE